MAAITWSFYGKFNSASPYPIELTQDSGLVVGGGGVYFRGARWNFIPPMRIGDSFSIPGIGSWNVQSGQQVYSFDSYGHALRIEIGAAEAPADSGGPGEPPGGPESPPIPPVFVPPEQTWARDPRGDNITVSYYETRVNAANADPGVAVYRWGINQKIGCKFYWEFTVDGADGTTLGGFGVVPCDVTTLLRPGVEENPGCLLYYESGAFHIANSGTITDLGAATKPDRIGVAVEVTAAATCEVGFWIGGVQVGATQTLSFFGAFLVPAVCTLNSTGTFRINDFA
jgi:hypothetical protein